MFKGFILGILFTIVVALIGGYAAVKMGFIPANADARPSWIERWIAGTSLNAAIDRDTANMQEPLQPTNDNLLAGEKLYAQHCEFCHGDSSGKPTYAGFGFYQKAPPLGRRGLEDDPDAETYWKVTHGIRLTAMPSFAVSLNDTQRWQLALFLKNLDKLPPNVEAAWKKTSAPSLPESILQTLPMMRRFLRPQGAGTPGAPG